MLDFFSAYKVLTRQGLIDEPDKIGRLEHTVVLAHYVDFLACGGALLSSAESYDEADATALVPAVIASLW